MKTVGNSIAGVRSGNAWETDTRSTNQQGVKESRSGWIVGFSGYLQTDPLCFMPKNALASEVCIKWYEHVTGDPNGTRIPKPRSTGRTISLLANDGGKVLLRFWTPNEPASIHTVILDEPGDYAIWGPDLHHEWEILRDSTVITVRWIPTGTLLEQ